MSDREVALDTLAREELGLDPDELGSPWSAAVSSMIAFAVGAAVALVPHVVAAGTAALVAAIVAVGDSLFVVGGGIGLLNGRSIVRSGLRQVVVGGSTRLGTSGPLAGSVRRQMAVLPPVFSLVEENLRRSPSFPS